MSRAAGLARALVRHRGRVAGTVAGHPVAAAVVLALFGAALAEPPPTIPLPSDLALDPPAAAVPATAARFAGVWAHGAWDGVLPHVLVVEAVDAGGQARVVYALGDYAEGNVRRGYRRLTGRIDGGVLSLDLGEGARAAYRLAGDSLRGTFTRGRVFYTVALTRAGLADVARVPAIAPGVVAGTTVRIPMTESGHAGKRLTLEATL